MGPRGLRAVDLGETHRETRDYEHILPTSISHGLRQGGTGWNTEFVAETCDNIGVGGARTHHHEPSDRIGQITTQSSTLGRAATLRTPRP
jgi:hypothetical protein